MTVKTNCLMIGGPCNGEWRVLPSYSDKLEVPVVSPSLDDISLSASGTEVKFERHLYTKHSFIESGKMYAFLVHESCYENGHPRIMPQLMDTYAAFMFKEDRDFRNAFILSLKDCQKDEDKEVAHIQADQIICSLLRSLGFDDVVDEYEAVEKWYH